MPIDNMGDIRDTDNRKWTCGSTDAKINGNILTIYYRCEEELLGMTRRVFVEIDISDHSNDIYQKLVKDIREMY
jgi:hypothetical protein